jgi:hypothetical protein
MNYWPTYYTFIVVDNESDFDINKFFIQIKDIITKYQNHSDFKYLTIELTDKQDEISIDFEECSVYFQQANQEDDWVQYMISKSEQIQNLLKLENKKELYLMKSTDDKDIIYCEFYTDLVLQLAEYNNIFLFDINDKYKAINDSKTKEIIWFD